MHDCAPPNQSKDLPWWKYDRHSCPRNWVCLSYYFFVPHVMPVAYRVSLNSRLVRYNLRVCSPHVSKVCRNKTGKGIDTVPTYISLERDLGKQKQGLYIRTSSKRASVRQPVGRKTKWATKPKRATPSRIFEICCLEKKKEYPDPLPCIKQMWDGTIWICNVLEKQLSVSVIFMNGLLVPTHIHSMPTPLRFFCTSRNILL